MIERVFILKRTETLRNLPEDVLTILASYLEEMHVDADQPIFSQGEIGKSMYIIVDGTVRIEKDGRLLKVMGSNEVMGERFALTTDEHRVSATAVDDCRLLRLDQDLLYEVMAGNPAVSWGIIRVLLQRFD